MCSAALSTTTTATLPDRQQSGGLGFRTLQVGVLYSLIGFETSDLLAGGTRNPSEATPIVQRLAELGRDLAPGRAKGF
jgi:hypothetical protein